MQWLIDLIIEAIGIPPVFISRGDPAGWDFTQATLTADGARHEMDLSAIIPAGASAVSLRLGVRHSAIGKSFYVYPHGTVNVFNAIRCLNQVSNISIEIDGVISLDSTRKVDYLLTNIVWDSVYVAVKGWWL